MQDPLAGDLRLATAPDADAVVRTFWLSEADGLANTLSRWGRFTRSVTLCTTEDRAVLRATAGAETSSMLCGLADLTSVTLLAPHRWTQPPPRLALYRVLLHELAHVLLFQRCAAPNATQPPPLPTWMREGMAEFVACGAPGLSTRLELDGCGDPARLARADAVSVASNADACYVAARVAFADWLAAFGERRLAAMCRAMRGGQTFASAHQAACGVSELEFLNGWAERLIEQLRRM